MLQFTTSSWTTAPLHTILYKGWTSSTTDYLIVKTPGNNTSGHGALLVSDNGTYFGRSNQETGSAIVDSATAPLDGANWGYINSSGLTTAAIFTSANDAVNLASGAFIDWGNGDARIQEGLVENYSLSFRTYDGTNVTTALRLDGDNSAHFEGSVDINGALSATTKSFDIEHPTKEGMRLHHGSLEGPEHGVYIRGRNKGTVIELPEYWLGLVDEDTITVQLTAIGEPQNLCVADIKDNKVYVKGVEYFYFIQAERKDIEKFEVEYEG